MSRWLRAAALTGCTSLLCATAGLTATSAFADDSTDQFTLSPAYAQVGQTVTLNAAGATTFPTDGSASVTFNSDVASTSVDAVSPTQLTAVVPDGASTGPVSVVVQSTTYDGPTFTLQQPTSWTASVTPADIVYGRRAMVSAALSTTGVVSGPVSGVTATLQRRLSSTGHWHTAAGTTPQTTALNGRVRWWVSPAQTGDYRVVFQQTPEYGGATSEPLTMGVRPRISLRHQRVVPALVKTELIGQIRPRLSGHLFLQVLDNGKWERAGRTTPQHGVFSFSIIPTAYATLRYRVVRAGDPSYAAATSNVLRLRVVNRALSYGAIGADVRVLQQRLRQLHYDVGPPSSFYGWDMVHAVTAFQKVQGFYRDGVASAKVWGALAHPKVPRLRDRSVKGTSVEVNLTKQILMIGKNGHVWRILDTSTAGGYTYTDSAGEQATAVTPTGHFTIQYKIDKLVKDKLGTLWRPSYFDSSGDAIHGEGDTDYGGDVPPYPASHGCVRITDLAVDRYYNVLAIGVPVWIYH